MWPISCSAAFHPRTCTLLLKHLHDLVEEIVVHGGESFQGLLEQIGLVRPLVPGGLGNEDDQTWMDVKRSVLLQEVPPVEGHDDVVVFDREWHQIPVLPTALADVGDVVGLIAARLGACDQVAAEALVDEKTISQRRGASALADFHSGP